jgi:CheY-like chemotaxis protein
LLNIVLAEDNPGDVMLVQEALEEHRIAHHLHVVKDGAQAVEFLAKAGTPGHAPCPDLLLLDLNLPKLDGFGVLQEFRKRPECVHTPVIIVTSSDELRDHNRIEALHVSSYFRKPLEYEAFMKLGAVVKEILGGS